MSDLEALKKTTVGWISPEGKVVACDVYKHLEVVGLQELCDERVAEFWQEADRCVQEEADSAGDDYYHPAWHRFDDHHIKNQVYRMAYEQGWVRIGLTHRNYVYAQSLESCLSRHNTTLVRLCKDLGDYKLHLEKIK